MSQSAGEFVRSLFLNPLWLVMTAGLFYMMFRTLRAVTARDHGIVNGVTAEGNKVVPLKAAFSGVRGFPSLFAIATNNATPLLAIGATTIEYRVIRKHRRPLADIEQIDVRTAPRTVNIEIQFKGEALTFAANVGTTEAARTALGLFPVTAPMTLQARAMLAPARPAAA